MPRVHPLVFPLTFLIVLISGLWISDRVRLKGELAKKSHYLVNLEMHCEKLQADVHSVQQQWFDADEKVERLQLKLDLLGKAVDVQGVTLDGQPFNWEEYRGKTVLIDVWAVRYFGALDVDWERLKGLYGEQHENGLEIVGLNVDHAGQRAEVRPFIDKEEIPWTTLVGKGGPPTINGVAVEWPPTRILVNPAGTVVAVTDELTDEFLNELNQVLADAPQ